MLEVRTFDELAAVRDVGELGERLRALRSNNANSFWLSHDAASYPLLLILTKNDVASLNYFSSADLPGFQSVGHRNADPGEVTDFYLDCLSEPTALPNSSIVTIDKAIEAAEQFYKQAVLPDAIDWIEL